jgi:hypothetical protein
MSFIIKEQNVEILNFNEFEKEITTSHLDYLKSQIYESDFERLQEAIKINDIVECAAITKSWNIDLNNVSSGMFRKYLAFHKDKDGSYILEVNNSAYYPLGHKLNFNSSQVLFILENGNVIPIDLWQRDFLIKKI